MGSKYWNIPMNFIGGCSPCSKGCTHCWAADCASKRLANHPLYKGLTKNGKWTGEVRVMPEYIKVIGGAPKTIFWCNMADMFHEKVGFDVVEKAFWAMLKAKQHQHLVLTKRIDRLLEFSQSGARVRRMYFDGELKNVHIGVTICTQKEADEILPIALKIPGFDWGSFEPLLENIKIPTTECDFYDHIQGSSTMAQWKCPKCGRRCCCNYVPKCLCLDWVVVGCESGPNRRPCKLEWIRSIVQQCKAAGVKCYVKQIDTRELKPEGVLNYKVNHDPAEWPKDLRVSETL